VVQVLDDGILPSGVAFLVTELLTGETLSARIQTHGPLSLAEVAQWGLQGVDALVAIHSAGVVHRDVKPDNLFLHCASPGQPRLKLIDFGIASVSWAETRLTRHGARVGTPGYASPEQEDGQQVDPRTDLYALGQCLKEAISGQAPASGEAGINWVLSGLPEQWTHVLFKLTARDREQRYADSREARAALSELVKLEEQFSVPRFWKGPLPSQSA
jgi:serine/threonine-protein kinase